MTNTEILEKIKGSITKGSVDSIFNFSRSLTRLGKNGLVSIENLNSVLVKAKIQLTPKNLEKLSNLFVTEETGVIRIQEFVKTVIGEMNLDRTAKIEDLFRRLDKDEDGYISTKEIVTKYDASKNPEVIAKKKTEKQILAQFMDAVDIFFSVIVIFSIHIEIEGEGF